MILLYYASKVKKCHQSELIYQCNYRPITTRGWKSPTSRFNKGELEEGDGYESSGAILRRCYNVQMHKLIELQLQAEKDISMKTNVNLGNTQFRIIWCCRFPS